MNAVVINNYGDENNLELTKLPIPKISDNQVLIQTKATSINPIDWKLREGYLKQMFDWTFPIILGWDISGVITKIGANVTDWHVGDAVFARPATTKQGTYAEYVAVDANLLAHKPDNISFEEAAAVPLAGETAYQALITHGKLKKGESVLIQAGSGGVGTYAIQIAKSLGAHVTTTTSSKHFELVKELGADEIIDYKKEKISDKLTNIDLVIDTIGGKTQEESFDILNRDSGRQISIVGKSKNTDNIIKNSNIKFQDIWLQPSGNDLQKIAALMKDGKVKSVIDTIIEFSRDGLVKAHKLSATNHSAGKIVIKF
ncbi:NADP-dependent oxidoreductase [Companilactobacillus sp. DQM5]|uniref:NADP-dependent oxidoreductase n=1 Tax=Companilactobacillus sp. DQM5 TaxID=3463359 RepID=UPI004057D120